MKVGALLFILLINPQFSINLQLLGGAIILQTLPSVIIGLYTHWLHRGALIAGWAAGMIVSIWTFYVTPNSRHQAGALGRLRVRAQPPRPAHQDRDLHRVHGRRDQPRVAFGGTALLKAFKVPDGTDHTAAADYFTDVADTRAPEPAVPAGPSRSADPGRRGSRSP